MTDSNVIDPVVSKRWFSEMKRLHEESESAKGAYMSQCRDRAERRKEVLERAEAAGVPKRELRTLVKRYVLETKIARLDDGFDDSTIYDAMVISFGKSGDLPLFAAALESAKDADEGSNVTSFTKQMAKSNRKGDAMTRGLSGDDLNAVLQGDEPPHAA